MRVYSRMNRVLLVGIALLLPFGALALSPKTCTLEYAPVCGSLEVQCITEPCNPILQTYSNRCFLESEGAVFMHEGECKEEEYGAPPPSACTREFVPVCGLTKIDCGVYINDAIGAFNKTSCEQAALKTFGNRCMLEAEQAEFLHEGECTFDERGVSEQYVPPDNCISWFDGCNTCSGIAGGPAACTLRACIGNEAPGYCISYATEDTPRPVLPTPDERSPETSEPPRVEPGGAGGESAEQTGSESPKSFVEQVWYSISSWVMSFF